MPTIKSYPQPGALDGTEALAAESSETVHIPVALLVAHADDQIEPLKADGSRAATADLPMGGNQVTGLGAPTADDHATPKSYVDTAVSGKASESDLAATNEAVASKVDGAGAIAAVVGNAPEQAPSNEGLPAVITPSARTAVNVADPNALAAVASPASGISYYVQHPKRHGNFLWHAGDFSAFVAADPMQIMFVPATGVPVTTGCWVRQRSSLSLNILWASAVDGSGSVDDGVTDAGPAINACGALLAVIGGGEIVFPVPAGNTYRVITPVLIKSFAPIKLRGEGMVGGTYSASYLGGQVILDYRGDASKVAVDMQVKDLSGPQFQGAAVQNIMIYTPDQAKASGGVGLHMLGCYPFTLSDVTVVGFATCARLESGGKGTINKLAISRAALCRLETSNIVDTVLFDPKFYEEPLPGYTYDLYMHTNSQLTIFGGSMEGGGGAARVSYNVYCQDSFLYACSTAFEASAVAACEVINTSATTISEGRAAIFRDCTWNDVQGYVVDAQRCRVYIENPSFQQSGSSPSAFRFVGDPSGASPYPFIGGGITGGQGTSAATLGAVEIVNAQGVHISKLEVTDTTTNNPAAAHPVVYMDGGCSNNIVESVKNTVPISGSPGIQVSNVQVTDLGSLNTITTCQEETWTPNVYPSSGSLGAVSVNYARFIRLGRRIEFNVQISVTVGSGAGSLQVSLPRPAYSGFVDEGVGRNVSTGMTLSVELVTDTGNTGNGLAIVTIANTAAFPVTGTNQVLRLSGFYEAA